MNREQALLPLTRIVLAIVALNALAGAVALIGFPVWAGRNFFWPIQTPINAALLGALYLAGAAAVTFVVIRNRWESTRFFVPVLVTAGALITAVTLIHRDKFGIDLRFWYWMGVYGLAPFLVIALYWMQERKGANWKVIVPMRPVTRWIAIVTGAVVAAFGVSMILFPQPFIAAWPWTTTPLLVRIFAAWFVAFGAGLLWFLVERNWQYMRLLPTLMVAAVVLDLLMVYLHRAEVTAIGASFWVYCAHLVAFGAIGLLLHELQRRPARGNAKASDSPYRLET